MEDEAGVPPQVAELRVEIDDDEAPRVRVERGAGSLDELGHDVPGERIEEEEHEWVRRQLELDRVGMDERGLSLRDER